MKQLSRFSVVLIVLLGFLSAVSYAADAPVLSVQINKDYVAAKETLVNVTADRREFVMMHKGTLKHRNQRQYRKWQRSNSNYRSNTVRVKPK